MKLAAPWVMVVRWGDLGHCVEMSHAGVALLRKHRIRATVLLCAVIAQTTDHGKGIVAGHTLRTLYDFYSQTKDMEPFDEWAKTQDATLQDGTLGQDYPFHLIIEAKDQQDRALLDLTAGQLRQATGGAIKMPAAVSAFNGSQWPSFELDGAVVKYMACPYPERVDPQHLRFPPTIAGVVGDLDYLTGLALKSPDAETFNRLMEANAHRAQETLEV